MAGQAEAQDIFESIEPEYMVKLQPYVINNIVFVRVSINVEDVAHLYDTRSYWSQ